MAIIHRTTVTPGKLELLAAWMPGQPWYLGEGREPELARAGGFRIDDPEGEVGIEFMVVTDTSGPRPVTYQVPVSYRGAPLEGAEQALIGTTEHGVLGRRWVYDGPHDPVLVAQLIAVLLGEAVPQAQSVSDTADPSVAAAYTGTGLTARSAPTAATARADDGRATVLLVRTTAAPGAPAGQSADLALRFNRVLTPVPDSSSAPSGTAQDLGHVTADWLLPDGTTARGPLVVVRPEAPAQP